MFFEELSEDVVFIGRVGFSVVVVLVVEQVEYHFVAGVRRIFSAFVDIAGRHDEYAEFAQIGCQVEHDAICRKDDDFVGARSILRGRVWEVVGVFHHQSEALFNGEVDGGVALIAAHLYGALHVKFEDVHSGGALHIQDAVDVAPLIDLVVVCGEEFIPQGDEKAMRSFL